MRKVELGGGVVGFETEGSGDRIGLSDPNDLRRRGWSQEAVDIYSRYRTGSDFVSRIADASSTKEVGLGSMGDISKL